MVCLTVSWVSINKTRGRVKLKNRLPPAIAREIGNSCPIIQGRSLSCARALLDSERSCSRAGRSRGDWSRVTLANELLLLAAKVTCRLVVLLLAFMVGSG